MLRRILLPVLATVVAFGLTDSALAQPAGRRAGPAVRYHLTRSVRLGTPDRWDYVVYDQPSHRVYVAHGDRLTVVDGRNGRIVGQVVGMPGGTHGIAISHPAGLGYTDDGRAGEAVAFSLKTLKVVKRLPAAPGADAVTIDPTSGHVFVVNGDPGLLTVIDPMRNQVVATVHVGSRLEYAVAGDNGKVYVNGVENKEIFRIDTARNRMDTAFSIRQCEAPHGLAIDTSTHRLFSSCENGWLVVVNSDTGKTVETLPIGGGSDAVAFDPTRKLIFSSNGMDGTLSVIREVDANTFVLAGTIKTALSARTMSVDPVSGRLFLAAANTTAKAMAAFRAARKAGEHAASPFVRGSLKLLFFDPGR